MAAEEVVEILFTAEYAAAAPVLRWYSILTVGRVAAFGSVIVAAGRPRYVFQASLLSLASNVAFSVPLLWVFGFVGPAMGTALAFVPIAFFYTWCIARAAELPLGQIFPLRAYGRVIGVGLLAVAAAIGFKLGVEGSAVTMLLGEAAVLVGVFAAVGTLLRVIGAEDWRYVGEWLRLKALTRPQ
ncbi:MAG: polysaccharide biosynthesis C-terminal domain-containing protein [Deltaproteobacteria bacterium]|nr:polysaccharide biosynthesis C-terminal domain-containing protein [Deltaproteobacteria bacterium]